MTASIPFLIPGDLATPTGGYAYARALIAHGPAIGLVLDPRRLPADFPRPSDASLASTAAVLAELPADRPALVDGLAFGVLPAQVLARARAPLVVLLHHPLGLETGLDPADRDRLLVSETAALGHARAVIVPSRHIAGTLASGFDVPASRITVAPPGTEPVPAAERRGSPPLILSAGTITPRKGFDVLVAALAQLADLAWTAAFVGSTDRDPDATAALQAQIAAAGLADRILLTGSVAPERMRALFAGADLFALASHYEGYGMVFAEALAAGLPIVGTTGGAVPELVPAGTGLLVDPGDVGGLRDALATLLTDRAAADRMAAAARAAGARLPRWDATAGIVKVVLDAAWP
ncbi:MAG: glycosyltransferase family 4 protein [Alphaproteobacteria bacterium]